ncbi:fibronectin type-III domain-containing protein 3A-like isoform X1 [Dermacentor variabilis]|uniref:fibronectin type-III domain-containing protein 3A-like isoform X1 n=1 Tax=Dermacentor variabilis TaxID=34621 RepID=UPI003F5C9B41
MSQEQGAEGLERGLDEGRVVLAVAEPAERHDEHEPRLARLRESARVPPHELEQGQLVAAGTAVGAALQGQAQTSPAATPQGPAAQHGARLGCVGSSAPPPTASSPSARATVPAEDASSSSPDDNQPDAGSLACDTECDSMPAIASTGSRGGGTAEPLMAAPPGNPEALLNGQQQQAPFRPPRQPATLQPQPQPQPQPLNPEALGDRGEPRPPSHWEVVNGEKSGLRCKGPVQKGYGAAPMGTVSAAAPSYVAPPHVVLLHINPGETIFFQMGDQMQFVQGPATVQLVSNSSTPPMAVPVQVPPGHVMQQIVDENGTLRHIILSPQPPHVAMPQPPAYTGAAPGAAQPAFYPYPATAAAGPTAQASPSTAPPFVGQFHSPAAMQSQLSPHSPQGHANPSGQPHKDERSQKQFFKLRKKLESRPPPSASGAHSESPRSSRSSPGPSGCGRLSHGAEQQDALVQLSSLRVPTVSQLSARQAVASWSTPETAGGATLDGVAYELLLSEKGLDRPAKLFKCGKSLEQKLEDLKPATEYLLCIQAHLDDIRGSPSPSVEFKTSSCEPDTPQPPKLVSRTKNTLVLKWNAPSDNGSKITCYMLEYDQGSDGQFVPVFTGLQKQFKVSKLAASTFYSFRLAATNTVGTSPWSGVSRFTTSGAAPPAPEPPKVVQVTCSTATLEWNTRPCDDSYTLSIEQEGSQHGFLPVYNGSDTKFTCTRLVRKTEYRFRLVAHNEEGSSGPSRVGSLQTLADRPGRPSRPSAKGRVHSNHFLAAWDAPKDDGGAPVTQYCLQMDSGKGFDAVYTGSEREATCSGLEPGSSYRLRVNCTSCGGTSDFSEVSTVVTAALCPGICDPPRLHGKPKAISAHLRWGAASSTGGAAVTAYELQVSEENDSQSRVAYRGPDMDCTVAGLLPGCTYLFRVRAVNSVGAGPWSEPLQAQSGAGAPDPPANLAVQVKGATCAAVSWDEAVCHGAPVSEYQLECRRAGGEEDAAYVQVYAGRNTHYEARSLEPASTYCFHVMACSSAGSSTFSDPIECSTPAGVPGPVGPLTCVRGPTSLEVSWSASACHGADITHYLVEVCEGLPVHSQAQAPSPMTSTPVTHTTEGTQILLADLQPETNYRVRVQAVNAVGAGPLSSPALRTSTQALPPPAPTLECLSAGHNSMRLRWTDHQAARDVLHYTLDMEVKPGIFVMLYQGPSRSYKALRLQENQAYRFRVRASSDAGDGPYSEPYTFTTSRAVPPAVRAPRASPLGESSCLLEWQPVKPVGDDPISYVVQLQHSGNSEFSVVYRGRDTSCTLSNLVPRGAFHWARVAAVRHCPQSTEPLCGPYGPATSFQLSAPSAPASEPASESATGAARSTTWTLGDQQWAGLLVGGFTLAAVLVAVLLQELVSWTQ